MSAIAYRVDVAREALSQLLDEHGDHLPEYERAELLQAVCTLDGLADVEHQLHLEAVGVPTHAFS